MKCILDGSRDVFPKLENLTLENLSYLTSICRWQPHHTFFPQVRELRLKDLRQLHEYVLPIQFSVKLRVLEVIKCICLLHIFQTEQIFEIDRDDSCLELPYMEILELRDLKGLQALQNSPHDSINRDKRLVLFNGKIKLPSLKTMKLERLSQISHVWDLSASKECATELLQSQAYGISAWFGNLKSLTVSQRDNTNSLFTSTILNSLLQLETLIVEACRNLKEVITNSSNAEDEANPTTMIIFPRLRVLRLQSMDSLRCFYCGPHFLEFPMLKELHLFELWEMKAFVLPSNQSIQPEVTTLFDGDQIGFPSLEHLEVSRMYHIELLQREGETTIFPLLSRLTLKGWPNLKSLHTINSKTLRFLDLRSIVCGQVLFSVQPTYMPSMSPEISWELEELTLSGFDSLEELVDDEKSVGKLLFCLKKLELCYLWQLRTIPWNMLKSLCSFTIYGLQSLTSLISITLLFEGVVLPSLEYIKVENCRSLETIVSQEELQEEHQDFVKHGITLFSSLKRIQFYSLPRLESFNNGSYEVHFPSLETVEIHECSSFKSFSMGPLRTPNSVMLDSKAMEVDTFDDLNSEVAAHQAAATARRNAEEVIKLRARAEEAKARRPRKDSGVWEGGKPIPWSFEDN